MKFSYKIIFAVVALSGVYGCKKYLDEKPNQSYTVPVKVADFQALLDYYPKMNNNDPGSGEISSADYYLLDETWQGLSTQYFRDMYTWQKDNLFAPGTNEWQACYATVYVANEVLDGLKGIAPAITIRADYNNVKGQALVFRAKSFLQIAAVWALAYDEKSAATDQGIPLRLNGDFNLLSVRSTVKETYTRIIQDLKESIPLLPVKPLALQRPSRPAAYALLARTYLFMRDYVNAGLYADSCLLLYNKLIDFNTLDKTATYPVQRFNPEVIMESYIPAPGPINAKRARIDSFLYQSYQNQDLRKSLFFKDNGDGTHAFKGSYEGGVLLFSGVATDEMYLTRAEASARQGDTNAALNDLNALLKYRFTGDFTPLKALSSGEALTLVINERRKELLMRGLRWMDIKRLNKEGAGITLVRKINGQTYSLPANDLRYALPLPDDIISLSGMKQNVR